MAADCHLVRSADCRNDFDEDEPSSFEAELAMLPMSEEAESQESVGGCGFRSPTYFRCYYPFMC